jgi:O-antigen ligase
LISDTPLRDASRGASVRWAERVVIATLICGFLTILDRGGNTDASVWLAAISLLLAATGTAWLYVHTPQSLARSQLLFLFALGSIVLFGAIGLWTVTPETWATLPGRSHYDSVIETLKHPSLAIREIPISFGTKGGMTSLLVALCCLMIALASAAINERSRLIIVYALCAIAAFQAIAGFAQIALRGASIVTLDYVGHVRAAGTFVNKNHFATFIAMILPLCISFAIRSQSNDHDRRDRQRAKALLWGALAFALFAAAIASLSRSGIATAVVVVALALGFEGARIKRRKGSKYLAISASIAAVAGCLALLAASESLFKAISDPSALDSLGARFKMYAATASGAVNFFPFGAGLGAFATAFPAFQPSDLSGYIEHAHNDYLQLLFEAGIVGVIFLGCTRARAESTHGVAYLIGASALAIHAMTDFPTHIPAIAFIGTFLFSAACAELRPPQIFADTADLSHRAQ